MSKSRLEIKVGLFVFIGLALFAGLMIEFSKGFSFRRTYEIILDTANVGGLRPNAMVLMSGVRVGSVSKTVLSPQGTNVAIHLKIYGDFVIHDDALFKIEAAGFLGDQYVAIYPGASSDFSASAVKDLDGFIKKLRDKPDPISKYLAANLEGDVAQFVATYPKGKNAEINPQLLMAQFLNGIIAGPPLFDIDRFQGIKLRPETLGLLGQRPSGALLEKLNRLLLEDAYPVELARQGLVLQPGDIAHAQEPFNLQEVARSTAGFIERLDNTAKKVDDAVSEVKQVLLSDKTLTDLTDAIANFRQASAQATNAMQGIDLIIHNDTAPLADTVSNLNAFSDGLKQISAHAQAILTTNEPQINSAISNLQTSTAMLTNLMGEIEAGHGLAGAIVKDQAMADDVARLANNLAMTTSNLNRLGLWHFIWYKPVDSGIPFPSPPPPSQGLPPGMKPPPWTNSP